MMTWADQASDLVFQRVGEPTEDSVATLSMLALFFYCQGLWRRSFIHQGESPHMVRATYANIFVLTGNACVAAHVLGLSVDTPGKERLWVSEVRRRRYWACYLTNCHASESVLMPDRDENAKKLTLPWTEHDFERGNSAKATINLVSNQSNGGLFCELIKIMTLW